MASLLQDVKKTAIKSVGQSIMRKGIVGKVLGKRFAERFGDKEEEDTRVADALSEQAQQVDNNNATLERIESIVMNISDNIYNIAGVWSKYVVSLEETKRQREEQRSRDAAAAEEAANEAAALRTSPEKTGTPSVASTDQTEKKGILSSILSSFAGTKAKFGSLLKKFAVVAVGVTAAVASVGALAAVSSSSSDTSAPSSTEDTAVSETEPSATPVASSPAENVSKAFNAASTAMSKAESGDLGGAVEALAPLTALAGQSESQAPAAAEPAAPPPPVAATQQTPIVTTEDQVKEYQSRIEANNKRLGNREKGYESRVASIKERYKDNPERQKELIDAETRGIEDYRGMVQQTNQQLQSNIEQLQQSKPAAQSSSGGTPTATPSGGDSGGSLQQKPQESSAGASMVPAPAPSTGADLNAASATVAAASEGKPGGTNVISDVSNNGSSGSAPKTTIPSPIADRGTLDRGIAFTSKY